MHPIIFGKIPVTVSEQFTRQQQMGEDIRVAKRLYEWLHGIERDAGEVNVNLWMREAKALTKEMRAPTTQDAYKLIRSLPPNILRELK